MLESKYRNCEWSLCFGLRSFVLL